ncbi:MAG: DUF6531 domain-containing protein, partial [Patescibacteria group bacterium]|nr:DUF6531 domain-containing protein [Patescibacteria group bacterium]
MRKIVNKNWFKNSLLLAVNFSIIGFLFFVGTIVFPNPVGVRGQAKIVIPDDSLVYQGKLSNLSVTKGEEEVIIEGEGQVKIYPVMNEEEVLSGAQVEVEIPRIDFRSKLTETLQGVYSLDLSEKLTIIPKVSGVSLAEMEEWQIQPLEYSLTLGQDQIEQKLDISPFKISDLESNLESSIQTFLSYLPLVGYIPEAKITSCSTNPCQYKIPLSLSFKAKIFDKNGNPLINKKLSATFEIPNHNYSETITLTTDQDGLFSYSREESTIIKISGGKLLVLAQPLEIEGASFVVAQQWWAPPPPPAPEPPAPTPRDQQNNGVPGESRDRSGDSNTRAGDDPINLTTGNFFHTVQDLFIPGKGLPIQFTRTYNSKSEYQGPFGFGWTHSYNVRLEDKDNEVWEYDEGGALIIYTKNPDGSYKSPAGCHSKLTKNPDGTYTLRRKYGDELYFDSQGKLTSIIDRNGNQVILTYIGNNLVTITDTSGRKITLDYDGSGRIIKLTDPLHRSTTYTYDSNNNLSSVTDPLGNKTTYEYKNFKHQHQLRTITDPRGNHRYITYDDETGKATSF